MTVRRKQLASASNAWRVVIYLSPRNNYEEVFYGTEGEATDREVELRRQKASGRLSPNIRRAGPPAKRGRKAGAQLNQTRIVYDGRGYIVLWRSWREREQPLIFKPPAVKPDLVMSLDHRIGLPGKTERKLIITELTRQMASSTGVNWVIPEGIVDWGEW